MPHCYWAPGGWSSLELWRTLQPEDSRHMPNKECSAAELVRTRKQKRRSKSGRVVPGACIYCNAAGASRRWLSPLSFLQEGTEGIYRDAEAASGKAVHVGGIDADNFALDVENRAAASTMGRGSVVDQLVADYVAEMSARGGRTNQGQGCQFASCANVVAAIGKPLVDAGRRL